MYDGEAMNLNRMAVARETLRTISWRDEQAFKFPAFISELNRCFYILKKGKQEKLDTERVQIMTNAINTLNVKITTSIQLARMQHSCDFLAASTFLLAQIVLICPMKVGTKRKASISSTSRQDGHNG